MTDDQGYSQQQIFDMLMESQYWSRAQMQDYQRSQLEQMLRHAKANVPFYKTRLDCMFRQDGSINWDRWEEIPILTKEDVRTNFEALQATEYPAQHGQVREHLSSGTTSIPLVTLHTELEEELWQASGWRAYHWWNLDHSLNIMRWPQASEDEASGAPVSSEGPWGPPWMQTKRGVGQAFTMPRNRPLVERLAAFRDYDIAYLNTRPHVAFAAALDSRAFSAPSLKAILAYSGNVELQHEEACRDSFGAVIHASYSSTEAGRIAYACETNNGFHLSEEIVFCEIVDASGRTGAVGEIGEVLVTPLLAAAMPLVRYAQGDRAALARKCSCGKTLLGLSGIQGRIQHMFQHPNGTLFAPTVPEWIRTNIGIHGWQFAQTSPKLINVRYLKDSSLSKAEQDWAVDMLYKFFDSSLDLRFAHVTDLPETASGKYSQFVNEYSPVR